MYKIYIKLKCRPMVVITNRVRTSILEAVYVHNKVSIVLRFGTYRWTILERNLWASVTQLKIMYKLVKWIAFSCTLFRDKFIIMGKNFCETVQMSL
jgi:hypothetical protein